MLLSSVAGPSTAPHVFPGQQFKLFVIHEQNGFTLYTRSRDISLLHQDLDDVLPIIPFAFADGLPAKYDAILDKMLHDIRANVPHAIRTASNEVIAVTRAEVEARVQAGDVVLG
jgi:hypothetical protein